MTDPNEKPEEGKPKIQKKKNPKLNLKELIENKK
jgi:hypothetical protein